jgi:hypothetical protein
MHIIKFKSFCTSKEIVLRIKRKLQSGRKSSPVIQQKKGLISRIYKELKKTK